MNRRGIGLLSLAIVAALGLLAWAAAKDDGSRDSAKGERIAGDEQPLSRLEAERRAIHLAVAGHDAELVEAQHVGDGWVIGIEAKNASPDLVKLLDKAHGIFTELARTRVEVATVALLFRTDALKNVYGHRLKDVALARVKLDGETFRKINWDGFSPRNFPRVADELWLHDILLPQVQQLAADGGPGQTGAGGQQQNENEGETSSEPSEQSGSS